MKYRAAVILGAATVAVGLSGAAVVVAAAISPDSASKIYYACLTKQHQLIDVRLSSSATRPKCPKDTRAVSWNTAGRAGPRGPQGRKGPGGPSGLDYKRIITVSPADTDSSTDNGAALLDAVNKVGNSSPPPSATDPYEIFLEPGTYDLGDQALQLPSDVYLVGADEPATTITSSVGANSGDATVEAGGGRVGIADLTVTNTNDGGRSQPVVVDAGTAWLERLDLAALGTNSTNVGLAIYGGTVSADKVTASASNSTFDDFGAGLFPFGATTPTLVATDSSFTSPQGGTQDGAYGLFLSSNTTAHVADSEVDGHDGSADNAGGSLTCFSDYDESFTALNSSCG